MPRTDEEIDIISNLPDTDLYIGFALKITLPKGARIANPRIADGEKLIARSVCQKDMGEKSTHWIRFVSPGQTTQGRLIGQITWRRIKYDLFHSEEQKK